MAGEIQGDNTKGDNDMFHTARGIMMKLGQKQIVTGMDKLNNPRETSQADTLFDSSPSRDINVGSAVNSGGIDYKALNNGNPLKD